MVLESVRESVVIRPLPASGGVSLELANVPAGFVSWLENNAAIQGVTVHELARAMLLGIFHGRAVEQRAIAEERPPLFPPTDYSAN